MHCGTHFLLLITGLESISVFSILIPLECQFHTWLTHGYSLIYLSLIQGQPFEFDPQSVQLNSFYSAAGAISFSGRWHGNGKKYSLTMSPAGNLAQVTALTESVDAALSDQKLNMSAISAGWSAAFIQAV